MCICWFYYMSFKNPLMHEYGTYCCVMFSKFSQSYFICILRILCAQSDFYIHVRMTVAANVIKTWISL